MGRPTFTRVSFFLVTALIVLIAGCVAAQSLWFAFNHNQSPSTGYFRGFVQAWFYGVTREHHPYTLGFRGETLPRWYWTEPTGFRYTRLDVYWGDASSEHAIVHLPEFTYEFNDTNGSFSRDILKNWLFGPQHETVDDRQIDAIFACFEDAAGGTLPVARHHPHHRDEPIRMTLVHFQTGFGISGLVYIWLVLWLYLVVRYGRRFFAVA